MTIARPIQARPTTYNGVTMRSRLEATAAAQYDAAGIPWRYETGAFGSGEQQYLPDFLLGNNVYVEVKPFAYFTDPPDFGLLADVQRRMETILDSVLDAMLAVHCPDAPRGRRFVASYAGVTREDGRLWTVHRDLLPADAYLPLPSQLDLHWNVAGGFEL